MRELTVKINWEKRKKHANSPGGCDEKQNGTKRNIKNGEFDEFQSTRTGGVVGKNLKQITNRIIALSVINLTTWHDNKVLIVHANTHNAQKLTGSFVISARGNSWQRQTCIMHFHSHSCRYHVSIHFFYYILHESTFIFLHDVILRYFMSVCLCAGKKTTHI